MAKAGDVVAAFDFDGTLSSRDNFVPFLRRVAGAGPRSRRSRRRAVTLVRRGRDQWTRNAPRPRWCGACSADATPRPSTHRPARSPTTIVSRHLRSEAVERADWHRTQGHRLVIVSASLASYLRPVAERLRFDAVLATELEVGDDGRLTGRIDGANVRGAGEGPPPRRVARGSSPAFVWAYGDSSGDKELWARADRAVRSGAAGSDQAGEPCLGAH